MATIPLSRAALRLGKTYHQVRAMVQKGALDGGVDDAGRWFVRLPALRRLEKRLARKRPGVPSNAGGSGEA
jgi:hypothetical protein